MEVIMTIDTAACCNLPLMFDHISHLGLRLFSGLSLRKEKC